MGGGASAIEGVDELLSTTYMIGRAISAITFPGIYRIYDFHSSKAPKLKNQRQFTFFAPDSDDEDENQAQELEESSYIHFFCVLVGDDKIYLENPLAVNQDGWTALHTCCMSFSTIKAGLSLIDETVHRGGNIDLKTIAGPGTFNSEWSPLHMACAYGIGALVEKLLDEGADANTVNSFGYTPMLDACHRGFHDIVEFLIKANANLRYIPSSKELNSSLFMTAPPQTALAESARCGFLRIVESLLNAGAPKDQANALGWTALHEACFYSRVDIVKILMLNGANASLRTKGGALPYHLAGIEYLRTMLEDMGGPEVVPAEGDIIDMVVILRELTMPDLLIDTPTDNSIGLPGHHTVDKLGAAECKGYAHPLSVTPERASSKAGSTSHGTGKRTVPGKTNDLLHSGGILGDLPSFNTDKPQRSIESISNNNDYVRVLGYGDTVSEYPSTLSQGSPFRGGNYPLDSRADAKDKTQNRILSNPNHSTGKMTMKQMKKRDTYVPPDDFPPSYLCELSHRPMSEPVKSIYGNKFDRPTIVNWIRKQGHICPLSGAPLSESDLKPLEDMGAEIRNWILQKSQKASSAVKIDTDNRHDTQHFESGSGSGSGSGSRLTTDSSSSHNTAAAAAAAALYDF